MIRFSIEPLRDSLVSSDDMLKLKASFTGMSALLVRDAIKAMHTQLQKIAYCDDKDKCAWYSEINTDALNNYVKNNKYHLVIQDDTPDAAAAISEFDAYMTTLAQQLGVARERVDNIE